MSLTTKLTSLMARPGSQNAQKDDVPWYMPYAGRGLGTVGGVMAILFGLFNVTGIFLFQVGCVIAGIWQMLSGFAVIVCEAPCCCFFVDYVQTLSDKVEARPYWQKAALYIGLSLPPFFICLFSLSTILGSGLIFLTGVVYGSMALGRKASAEEMRTAASMEAGQATAPRSNLVTNAAPMGVSPPAK